MVGDYATRESSVVRYCCSDRSAGSARRFRPTAGYASITTHGTLSVAAACASWDARLIVQFVRDVAASDGHRAR